MTQNSNFPRVTQDDTTGDVYVSVRLGEVVRTESVMGDAILYDLDVAGRLLGVEILAIRGES